MLKKCSNLMLVGLFSAFSALNYAIFVFPNRFAPAGIDGICTMIQYVLDINIGYLSLCANVPLLLLAFLYLNRDFSVKTAVYILSFSVVSILLGRMDLTRFSYLSDSGSSIVLAPLVAGTLRGMLYYFTLNRNASSGGIDIISALVKLKRPYLNLMHIIFFFNMLIALSSYFVYGMHPEPVILSILYAFITTSVTNALENSKNQNIKYEIIAPDIDEMYLAFSERFQQSATVIDAHGAYSGINTKMLVCVVNKKKAPYIEEILLNHPECTVFKTTVGRSLSGVSYK